MSACKDLAASISSRLRQFTGRLFCLALVSGVTASPVFGQSQAMVHDMDHDGHGHVSARFVQIVQDATRKYLNVNEATGAGYAPFLGCVTGPDHGAMGIHYVNGALLNSQLYADQPQALIYEPEGNRLRLIGVEYILDATTWLKNNHNTPPVLGGRSFSWCPARTGSTCPHSLNCMCGPGGRIHSARGLEHTCDLRAWRSIAVAMKREKAKRGPA
jgi:hypothetical protein